MAINPVAFARTVNEQFHRYQLTAFPLTDERLARQVEEGIRGAEAGRTFAHRFYEDYSPPPESRLRSDLVAVKDWVSERFRPDCLASRRAGRVV